MKDKDTTSDATAESKKQGPIVRLQVSLPRMYVQELLPTGLWIRDMEMTLLEAI